MNQDTETQVLDTLPECENQEQNPAHEQVCQGKPSREIFIHSKEKNQFSKMFEILTRLWRRTLTRLQLLERRRRPE